METVRVGELLVPSTLANYGTDDDDGNECTVRTKLAAVFIHSHLHHLTLISSKG